MENIEEAKKLIEEDKTKRALECAKEISEILKKYNCEFQPNLNVVAKQ